MERDDERWARLLYGLLRLVAVAEFTAVFAVFLPVSWMASVHRLIGLGDFPEGVVVPYLARHLSAMYVIHGGFLWVASTAVRRHAALIRFIVWQGIVFSVFITILDLRAGFPWYWWMAEGPGLTGASVGVWWLQRQLHTEET